MVAVATGAASDIVLADDALDIDAVEALGADAVE